MVDPGQLPDARCVRGLGAGAVVGARSLCAVYNGIQLWDQRSARRPRTGLLSEEASSIKP